MRCGKLTLLLLTAMPMLMSGCTREPSSAAVIGCSTVLPYTADEQQQMIFEKDSLPVGSIIRAKAFPDYGRMRDEARKCAELAEKAK